MLQLSLPLSSLTIPLICFILMSIFFYYFYLFPPLIYASAFFKTIHSPHVRENHSYQRSETNRRRFASIQQQRTNQIQILLSLIIFNVILCVLVWLKKPLFPSQAQQVTMVWRTLCKLVRVYICPTYYTSHEQTFSNSNYFKINRFIITAWRENGKYVVTWGGGWVGLKTYYTKYWSAWHVFTHFLWPSLTPYLHNLASVLRRLNTQLKVSLTRSIPIL